MDSYGTGADGNVTISSNTTLTSDKNYANLIVNAGVTLNTAGYIVRVSGTLTNNGIITDSSSGGNGGNGGAGIAASSGFGTEGNPGSAGSAGAGSAGSGGCGGGGGAKGGGSYNCASYVVGGSGGAGGNGGKGGGWVRIYAANFINNGTIHANGSSGSNGSAGGAGGHIDDSYWAGKGWSFIDSSGGGGGGGAGGNGGNGGVVDLIYETRTEGTVTANGGAGGTGGAGGASGGYVSYGGCGHWDARGGGYPNGGNSGTGMMYAGYSANPGAAGSSSNGNAGVVRWTCERRLIMDKVVQMVSNQTSSLVSITSNIPFDDTIPQNTEGGEVLTVTITPRNANSRLKIDFVAPISPVSTAYITSALFKDSVASAIASVFEYVTTATGGLVSSLSHIMTAGTTSPITFKVRVGAHTGNVNINGANGTRRMGGVAAATLTVTEIETVLMEELQVESTVTLSGASGTIQVNIPANCVILGAQLRVDTAITGATTWNAQFTGGNAMVLVSSAALAKNTKVNSHAGGFTSDETDILITPNGSNFTAGVIRAIVYYRKFQAMPSI